VIVVIYGIVGYLQNFQKLDRMPDRANGRVIGNHVRSQENWFQQAVAASKLLGIK
jgi:hypothetical protein